MQWLEAQSKLGVAQHVLERWLGPDRTYVELNDLELERMATTMAKFPEAYYGIIDPTTIRSWPWVSVLDMSVEEREQ